MLYSAMLDTYESALRVVTSHIQRNHNLTMYIIHIPNNSEGEYYITTILSLDTILTMYKVDWYDTVISDGLFGVTSSRRLL